MTGALRERHKATGLTSLTDKPPANEPQDEFQSPYESAAEPSLIAHPGVLAGTALVLLVGGLGSYMALLSNATIRATAWPTFAMLALAVGLAVAAVRVRRRWWTLTVAIVTPLMAGSFVFAFFVGMGLPEAEAGPGPGDVAPNFTLMDHTLMPVTLAMHRGRGPVLLVFYRGHW